MVAKRWVRGVVGAGALAAVLAACGAPPVVSAPPAAGESSAGAASAATGGATAGDGAGPGAGATGGAGDGDTGGAGATVGATGGAGYGATGGDGGRDAGGDGGRDGVTGGVGDGATGGAGDRAAGGDGAECPSGGVRLVEGDGSAAMGLRAESVQLVNCGTEPYALEGYPEVLLLDEAGRPLEATVAHGSAGITTGAANVDAPPQRLVVAPGRTAYVPMVWRNLVTDSGVVAADGWVLEVMPRPGAPRLRLRLTRPVDLGNTGKLGIGPWQEVSR